MKFELMDCSMCGDHAGRPIDATYVIKAAFGDRESHWAECLDCGAPRDVGCTEQPTFDPPSTCPTCGADSINGVCTYCADH